MKRKIGKEPAEYRREQDKKRRKGDCLRNTAGNRTRNGGRVIACGIPQGAGQETAEVLFEFSINKFAFSC